MCSPHNQALHSTAAASRFSEFNVSPAATAGEFVRYAAMKTLGELAPDDVSAVAEIPPMAVRVLWVDDFWDGPLSGIAEWEGRRLRVAVHADFCLCVQFILGRR